MRKTVALLVVLLAATAARADKRVHQMLALSPSGSVSINTHNGSVTINTWNQSRVDVEARVEETFDTTAEDVEKTQVRVEGSGDHVSIVSDYDAVPTLRSWLFGTNRVLPPVHYTISMPASASVEIDSHNASIRITGLRNNAYITGHNGDVDLMDHDGGAAVNVHNGAVRVAFRNFAKAAKIETHNGSVEVRMPSSSRFRVAAYGHHLGVESDFPTVTRQMDGGTYLGEVNGGGPELRVSTHNGSVRIRSLG